MKMEKSLCNNLNETNKSNYNINHKHSSKIYKNFVIKQFDETCEICILNALAKFTKFKMNFEKYRVESFYNWPIQYVDIKTLAKIGFYYTKRNDRVKCNYCELEIDHWSADDDPYSRHHKWSPFCEYSNKNIM